MEMRAKFRMGLHIFSYAFLGLLSAIGIGVYLYLVFEGTSFEKEGLLMGFLGFFVILSLVLFAFMVLLIGLPYRDKGRQAQHVSIFQEILRASLLASGLLYGVLGLLLGKGKEAFLSSYGFGSAILMGLTFLLGLYLIAWYSDNKGRYGESLIPTKTEKDESLKSAKPVKSRPKKEKRPPMKRP